MKKNHFYISYAGNKRTEAERIYNYIDFSGIDTVIEPFCGTCAMSYFINTKIPNLNYIFNDNNKFLKDMYEILIDDNKIKDTEEKYKVLIKDMTKDKYYQILKENNLLGWLLTHKYYTIRAGLYPLDGIKKLNELNLKSHPIYEFFKNNKDRITFYNKDAVDIVNEYKNNSNCLILFDPPYLDACNDFYNDSKVNIYEYLYFNQIRDMKAKVYLILENNWIIQLLFKDNEKIEYDKFYQPSKKKTTHLIIKN